MRLLLFFDLPTITAAERKHYSQFRKFLINEGFLMMQESVYTKLALNSSAAELVKNKVHKNKPPKGLVQMLLITEKQFASMDTVVGQPSDQTIDSTDRMIIL